MFCSVPTSVPVGTGIAEEQEGEAHSDFFMPVLTLYRYIGSGLFDHRFSFKANLSSDG